MIHLDNETSSHDLVEECNTDLTQYLFNVNSSIEANKTNYNQAKMKTTTTMATKMDMAIGNSIFQYMYAFFALGADTLIVI